MVDRSMDLLMEIQALLKETCLKLDKSSDSLTGSDSEVTRLLALLNYLKTVHWLIDPHDD